jgi:GDP-L-fucose synthase
VSPDDVVYVAGHRGMVGSALCRALAAHPRVITTGIDLRDESDVERFFAAHQPDYVLLAAARVGGIAANMARPAEFIRDNLLIQTHVVHAASRHGVKRLVFLGSSCIYPRDAAQPISEQALMTGALETTNAAYAMAKLAGIAMVQAYGLDAVCLMPTNLYGPGDSFDPESSHLVPGLMGRMHPAKLAGDPELVVWGTGTPRRELMHVDDLASAVLHFADVGEGVINVGTGQDHTIAEIAEMLADVVGYRGRLVYDPSRPDGTPRKLLNVNRATSLGWRAQIPLRRGLEQTYVWLLNKLASQPV